MILDGALAQMMMWCSAMTLLVAYGMALCDIERRKLSIACLGHDVSPRLISDTSMMMLGYDVMTMLLWLEQLRLLGFGDAAMSPT